MGRIGPIRTAVAVKDPSNIRRFSFNIAFHSSDDVPRGDFFKMAYQAGALVGCRPDSALFAY